MLVFGFLKRRKFQECVSKTMRKMMLRVCYTFRGCACGHLLPPLHTFTGYIHASWVSLCSFIHIGYSYGLRKQTMQRFRYPRFLFVANRQPFLFIVRFGVFGGRGFFLNSFSCVERFEKI